MALGKSAADGGPQQQVATIDDSLSNGGQVNKSKLDSSNLLQPPRDNQASRQSTGLSEGESAEGAANGRIGDNAVQQQQQVGSVAGPEFEAIKTAHLKQHKHHNPNGAQQVAKKPAGSGGRHSLTGPAIGLDGGSRGRDPNPGRMRHVIAVLALSSIFLANMNRQAYNQALVRMVRVRETPVTIVSNTVHIDPSTSLAPPLEFGEQALINQTTAAEPQTTTAELFEVPLIETEPNQTEKAQQQMGVVDNDRYEWTGAQISLLQAAFSYGYTPFMIPGGRLSELYGAKWVVFLSGFGSALCSLLTPMLADFSFALLLASRVLMGVCQTGVSPALYALLTRWLPAEEASIYLPMIKVGVMIGFMAGSLINSFLRWRYTFYTVGAISLMWSALWAMFASSVPEEHRLVTKRELKFIQDALAERAREAEKSEMAAAKPKEIGAINEEKKKKKKLPAKKSAPWLNIITNPAVLAMTFTKFTIKVSTDTQTIQIPMYLRNVFHVSDQLNGALNATNFAIQAVFTGLAAYAAKECVVRQVWGLSKTSVRRIFQGINNFGMAAAYILISFNMNSLGVVCAAVIFLSITSMFGAGGESVSPVDFTTEYSASIMAIANSVANLSGIILPVVVSFLLDNQLTDPAHWNRVFCFIGGVLTLGGLSFCCLVEAKLQDFETKKKLFPSKLGWPSRKKKAYELNHHSTAIEMKAAKK